MNFGQVLSKRTNKILKQSISKTGYYTIATKIGGRNGISKCFKVHRWIAEIFIPNDLNKPFINHKDGNKLNSIDNLEWVTNSENVKHAYSIGLNVSKKGTNNKLSKLSLEQVLFIRKNYGTMTKRQLAKILNVGATTIHNVAHNMIYKDDNMM